MRHIIAISTLVLITGIATVHAQQPTEFPIGVFTFGGNDVDYTQMKDTLGLTWIQGWGGWDNNPSALETNAKGLKVMSIRDKAYTYSKAQRMIWEAENSQWPPEQRYMYNYFETKETGEPFPGPPLTADSWRCVIGPGGHSPGYMVRSPWPNNEYHYSRTEYIATFRMKILKSAPNTDTVAVLSLYCPTHGYLGTPRVLYDSSFALSDTSFEFKVPFSLEVSCDPPCEDGPAYLTGGTSGRPNHIVCTNVDIRVWWAGHRTTWLDYVVVDDLEADSLFAGIHNQDLRNEADDYDFLSNVQRVYLTDEPPIPGWLPHEQIKRFLRDSVLTTNKPAITASPWTDEWVRRFSQDAQPSELLWDWYVLFPTVPSPSMTDSQAVSLGVTQYVNNTQYNDSLQKHWDDLERRMWPVDSVAKASGKQFWFVPQLHGTYVVNTGGFNVPQGTPGQGLRPPTGVEVQAQINIALAFGANGIVPYPYGTDSVFWAGSEAYMTGLVARDTNIYGKHTNHFSNTTTLPNQYGGTKSVYTGYSEKWDSLKSINSRIKRLEQTLLSLTSYQGAKSWKSNKTYGAFDAVTAVSAKNTGGTADASAAVLTGQFNNRGYLYVVNRRCDTRQNNMGTRDISLTLGTQQSSWLVTEIVSDSATGKVWVVKAGAAFTDRFAPGEGKLYKLEAATVSGTKTFNYLKFVGSGVLTLASNANITARGNMDTVNIVLGSNAIFKADTGSSMIIVTDNALTFGSGSVLQLHGNVIAANGHAGPTLTVPYGATVRMKPGAVYAMGSFGSLVVQGTLSAIGTLNNPVTITKAPNELTPGGVYLFYGSSDTLEHCHITELYTGVTIGACTPIIRNNRFSNCSIAISSDADKRSPVIENNLIDSCWIGLDVYTGPIGVPIISGNEIRGCEVGVALNPWFRTMLTGNWIHSNSTGVFVDGSAPVLRGNIIESNTEQGVFAAEYSNPRFGDMLLADPGNNVLRNNAVSELRAVNSTPFLGMGCERMYGGWNSVYGDALHVHAEKGAYVSANWNWWGTDPPKEEQFLAEDAAIDYDCWMPYDPNEGMRPSASPTFASGVKDDDGSASPQSLTTERAALLRAVSFRAQGYYRKALAIYAGLIRTSPSTVEARVSLGELRRTFHDFIRSSGDSTLQSALQDSLRTLRDTHPNALLRRLARTLVAAEIATRYEFASAIEEYELLLQSATTNLDRAICIFALFNINANGVSNRDEAQRYLSQLQTEFPTDIRTRIATIRFDAISSQGPGNGLLKPSLATTGEQHEESPLKFTLSQNYPNPFNPSTTIKYDLTIDAHVSLKLYDVLGREVFTVTDGPKKAGSYSETFSSSMLSSGVYFYRIQAGPYSQTRKLTVLR